MIFVVPANDKLLVELLVVEAEMLPPPSKSAIERLLADSTQPSENKNISNIFAKILPQLFIKYQRSMA